MSRYDHKIEPSLEGIEHLSKEMKMKIKKMKNSKTTDKKWELKMKEKNHYYLILWNNLQNPSKCIGQKARRIPIKFQENKRGP